MGFSIQMDPDTLLRTGRVIPFSEQVGANPGAFRHFVVDRVRGLLLYTLTFQDLASGGAWNPVPPLTQWPSRTTQLNNLPITTAGHAFRVEAAPTGN